MNTPLVAYFYSFSNLDHSEFWGVHHDWCFFPRTLFLKDGSTGHIVVVDTLEKADYWKIILVTSKCCFYKELCFQL